MSSPLVNIVTNKELIDSLNRPRVKIDSNKELGNVPLLKHIRRLSFDLPIQWKNESISAVGIYARRYISHDDHSYIWYLEAAKDSGYEGVACVDDTARAIVLAIKIYTRLSEKYKQSKNIKYKKTMAEIKRITQQWINFLFYMQENGEVRNFILDMNGTKNTILENSSLGGVAWTSRALWAFAYAYKAFGNKKYLDAYSDLFIITTDEMSYLSLSILSALEIVSIDPTIKIRGLLLSTYLKNWAEEVMKHFDKYFHTRKIDGKLDPELDTYGYYELEAMARVGVYLKNEEYLKAVQKTIHNFIEPNLHERFYEVFPTKKYNTNLYGVSSIINGLIALCDITKNIAYPFFEKPQYYELLALAYSSWMYRENTAGAIMWYPSEGICLDNTAEDNRGDIYAGTACGAESAIEGGITQLGLNFLRNEDRWLIEEF